MAGKVASLISGTLRTVDPLIQGCLLVDADPRSQVYRLAGVDPSTVFEDPRWQISGLVFERMKRLVLMHYR